MVFSNFDVLLKKTCRLQKFVQSYINPYWSEVSLKIKIYCSLWTDFTTCSCVFIADFEPVSAGSEAKSENDYRK